MSSPNVSPLPGRRRWLRRGWLGRWIWWSGAGALLLLLVLWPLSYWAEAGLTIEDRISPWSRADSPPSVSFLATRGGVEVWLKGAGGREKSPELWIVQLIANEDRPRPWQPGMRVGQPRTTWSPCSGLSVGVAVWLVLLALLLVLMVRPLRTWFRRRGLTAGAVPCPDCGYDRRVSLYRCPECGSPVRVGKGATTTSGGRWADPLRRGSLVLAGALLVAACASAFAEVSIALIRGVDTFGAIRPPGSPYAYNKAAHLRVACVLNARTATFHVAFSSDSLERRVP